MPNEYLQIAIDTGIAIMKREGKKLRDKDRNNQGKDDAAGLMLLASAKAMGEIDISNISETSLEEFANALEAAAKEIRRAAGKIDED